MVAEVGITAVDVAAADGGLILGAPGEASTGVEAEWLFLVTGPFVPMPFLGPVEKGRDLGGCKLAIA